MVKVGPGSLTPRKEVPGALCYVNSMCNSAIQVIWEVLSLFILLENSKNRAYSQVNIRNKNFKHLSTTGLCISLFVYKEERMEIATDQISHQGNCCWGRHGISKEETFSENKNGSPITRA